MKTSTWWLALLVIGLLPLGGSQKTEQAVGPTSEFFGVNVDLPKLDTEFSTASQDVQERAAVVKRFFRYGQFPRAVLELDALAKTPGLTESQKKLVNDLIEQTKQVIAKAPPQSGP